MMQGLHDDLNQRLELRVESTFVEDYRAELSGLLRSNGVGHLLDEVFTPLSSNVRMRAALAFLERPWPPAGVGARSLRGFMLAVVGSDGQALLTPSLVSVGSITNVGMAAALTKLLLEDIAREGIDWVAIFVNDRSRVVAAELHDAGFERRQARVVTADTQFTAFGAAPTDVLERLGLADTRLGDVLNLNLSRPEVARLTSFHLALAAGVANYWADRPQLAEIFPGFIDWAALPPGGITGTPGPTLDPFDPIVVLPRVEDA